MELGPQFATGNPLLSDLPRDRPFAKAEKGDAESYPKIGKKKKTTSKSIPGAGSNQRRAFFFEVLFR